MSHQLLLELSLGLNGDDAFLLNFVLIIDFKPSPNNLTSMIEQVPTPGYYSLTMLHVPQLYKNTLKCPALY